MRNLLILMMSVCVACEVSDSTAALAPPVASGLVATLSNGCVSAPVPSTNGNPGLVLQPSSATASDFTRVLFPRLVKQGSWNSSGQFIADMRGFALPALVATSGNVPGWLSLPFDSGETVSGITMTACSDSTTLLDVELFATQFSAGGQDNFTDGLMGAGGSALIGSPGLWHNADISMEPIFMNPGSTLWMSVAAVQTSPTVPQPPPSFAIGQIVLHMSR